MVSATVNVSFPRRLLERLDQVAKQEARSRSELLRAAALQYVERKRRWEQLLAFWRTEARRRGLKPSDVEHAIAEVRAQRRGGSQAA